MSELRFQVTGLSEDDAPERRRGDRRPPLARLAGWTFVGIAVLLLFGVMPGRVDIISPVSGTTTLDAQILVSGRETETGADTITLSVNGSPQTLPVSGGLFEGQVSLLPGENIIAASANGYSSDPITIVRRLQALVRISSPSHNTATTQNRIDVNGIVENSSDNVVTLDVNGATQVVSVQGDRFSATVPLAVGRNVIRALIPEASPVEVEVSRLATGIAISSPSNGYTTDLDVVSVTGMLDNSDATAISLKINESRQNVPVRNGSFSSDVVLRLGENRIQAMVGDASSNEIVVNRTLPPVIITLTSPQTGPTQSSVASVRGTIQNTRRNDVTLTVNGSGRMVSVRGVSFAAEVPLEVGQNVIRASQGDAASNEIIVNRLPPQTVIKISASPSGSTQSSSARVTGAIANSQGRTVTLTVNGSARSLVITNGGFASDIELASGENHIRASQGETLSNEMVVNRLALPTLIKITSPRGSVETPKPSISVGGTITNSQSRTITLTVNGSGRTLRVINDRFSSAVELEVGDNRIQASQGEVFSNEITVRRLPPASIQIVSPKSGRVSEKVVTVNGKVENFPGNTIRLTVNGLARSVRLTAGSFTAEVKLLPGNNLIEASVPGASDRITLVRPEARIFILSPNDGTITRQRVLVVTGRVENVEGGTIALTVNGRNFRVDRRLDEFQSKVMLSPGRNLILASLDNAASSKVSVTLQTGDEPPSNTTDECSKINCDCKNVRASLTLSETWSRVSFVGESAPPPFFTGSVGTSPQDRQAQCRAAEDRLRRTCKETGKVSGNCPAGASGPNAWPPNARRRPRSIMLPREGVKKP